MLSDYVIGKYKLIVLLSNIKEMRVINHVENPCLICIVLYFVNACLQLTGKPLAHLLPQSLRNRSANLHFMNGEEKVQRREETQQMSQGSVTSN